MGIYREMKFLTDRKLKKKDKIIQEFPDKLNKIKAVF
jgi:hypothetical protein